jgi:hypothetical protein
MSYLFCKSRIRWKTWGWSIHRWASPFWKSWKEFEKSINLYYFLSSYYAYTALLCWVIEWHTKILRTMVLKVWFQGLWDSPRSFLGTQKMVAFSNYLSLWSLIFFMYFFKLVYTNGTKGLVYSKGTKMVFPYMHIFNFDQINLLYSSCISTRKTYNALKLTLIGVSSNLYYSRHWRNLQNVKQYHSFHYYSCLE